MRFSIHHASYQPHTESEFIYAARLKVVGLTVETEESKGWSPEGKKYYSHHIELNSLEDIMKVHDIADSVLIEGDMITIGDDYY